jgi:hypothetical protein
LQDLSFGELGAEQRYAGSAVSRSFYTLNNHG